MLVHVGFCDLAGDGLIFLRLRWLGESAEISFRACGHSTGFVPGSAWLIHVSTCHHSGETGVPAKAGPVMVDAIDTASPLMSVSDW